MSPTRSPLIREIAFEHGQDGSAFDVRLAESDRA